jgi:hypothetical protein
VARVATDTLVCPFHTTSSDIRSERSPPWSLPSLPMNYWRSPTKSSIQLGLKRTRVCNDENSPFKVTSLLLNSLSLGVIVSFLRRIFKVLVIGFRRYPTLAAIHIDTPFSLLCASLYTLLDFVVTVLNTGFCRNDFYPTDKTYEHSTGTGDDRPRRYLKYYGTGSKLVFLQLLGDIPRYMFLSYITVKLISLFFKRIRYRSTSSIELTRDQKNLLHASLPHSVESRYVKNMLGITVDKEPTNRFAKTFRFIYAWRNDFRFSSRIICVYAAIFLLLFFMTAQVSVRVTVWFDVVFIDF